VREGTEIAGRYVLETMLGHGGMGEVWRGSDRQLRRPVAVKVMQERVADAKRFEREARISARLQHPGITVVHDFGTHDGLPFIVMELLRGHDLKFELAMSPAGLPPDRVVPLAIQAAEALQAAHDNQVVHRDLKPANLFLQDNGLLKICDFGIAWAADLTESLTATDNVIGSAQYMSPEQCEGRPVDRRSDLYSLGCVLYALLTGQPPFPHGEKLAIMYQQRYATPEGPRTRRPEVPEDLDRLVLTLLAKDPDQRPADAGQVIAALKGAPIGRAPERGADTRGGATASADPSTYVVDSRKHGDFTSVTAAIRAAQPGARILVRPGVYEGGLVVDKALQIRGDGPVADIEIRAYGAQALRFEADDQDGQVANLTLRQIGGAGAREYHAVDVLAGRLELDGCDISGESSTCVAAMEGASLALHDSTVHHGGKSGILVCDGSRATLEDNEVTGNGSSGVQVRNGARATLRRNRIRGNAESGVWVYEGGHGILEDNDITGNGRVGVSVSARGNITLRGNRINRNTEAGVRVREGGRAVAEDNDLRDNFHGAWNIARGSEADVRRARNKE
jgi:parallel beta-helix repeat protein